MKKMFFIILFFISLFAQAQITFQKTYGGAGSEYVKSLQQTTDGGYIITGITSSFGAGNYDVSLIKIDIGGDTLWTRTFGGTNDEFSRSLEQTTDGGYITGGYTLSFGAGNLDVYLLKIDASGNTMWTKTFGGIDYDYCNSIQQTTDGGYIIVGHTLSFGSGGSDIYLIKTDAIGDTIWTKTFGGITNDWGYSVQQTTDGGYIVVGGTQSFGAGLDDIYMIKTNANGNILWSKTFGGTSNDDGSSIQQTTDGGYIIVGYTQSFGSGSADVYQIKTDNTGNALWSKTFGGTLWDNGFSVQQTTDTGYIISGETHSFGAGDDDVYLIKTDANGNVFWTKTFGGTNYDYGNSIQQTSDGGYICAGLTVSFGIGGADAYIIKMDANGNNGCNESNPNTIVTAPATIVGSPATQVSSGGIVGNSITQTGSGGIVTTLCYANGANDLQNEKIEIKISPNPFSSEATVNINGQLKMDNGKFIMYDVYGRKVRALSIVNFPFSIERGGLPSGIYFYKLSNSTEVIGMGKVVVE